MLEKIKRKITADSPLYYDRPHEAVTRLNELYSRFVRYKNVDKKPYENAESFELCWEPVPDCASGCGT